MLSCSVISMFSLANLVSLSAEITNMFRNSCPRLRTILFCSLLSFPLLEKVQTEIADRSQRIKPLRIWVSVGYVSCIGALYKNRVQTYLILSNLYPIFVL